MPRHTSTSRKVARAAATGGGRTSRGRTPVGWYAVLSLIVILGVASVAFSRYQYEHPRAPVVVHPATGDHWRAAFAFDLCGTMAANPPQVSQVATTGLSTKGDGIIYIDPTSSANSGHNATLGHFVTHYPNMVLTSTRLGYPGKPVLTNGDKCGNAPGQVQVKVWTSQADPTGQISSGNPGNLLLENGQLVTLAFVPKGSAIPQPPSRTALAKANPQVPTTSTP